MPAQCQHPTMLQDWADYNADNTTSVNLDNQGFAIQEAVLEMKCHHHHFLKNLMESENTFVTEFSIECSYYGNWTGLDVCERPVCEALDLDTATVGLTVWGEEEAGQQLEGAEVKLQCSDQGATLSHADTLPRLFLSCHKKQWWFQDHSLCADQAQSCSKPAQAACQSVGCIQLPTSFQERVVYDPALSSYMTGARVTVSCSNQEPPVSTLHSYGDDQKVLAMVTPVYEAIEVPDNGFCPHDECQPSLGVEWHGKGAITGSDCIEEGDTAYCIKSSKLKWNGSHIIFTGKY